MKHLVSVILNCLIFLHQDGFFTTFEMEAKLSTGLGALPGSLVQQVVDELLVLDHAESLRRESGSHVKVPDPQGFFSDVFRHECKDNINLLILIDFFQN